MPGLPTAANIAAYPATVAETVAQLESEGRTGPVCKGRMRFVERSPFGDTADIGDDKAIRNVKVIGESSANRRIYPREVLEKAIPKFEGARVFVNHRPADTDQPHDVEKLCGVLEGVHYDAAKNGLVAKRLVPCGPSAHILESCAKTAAKLCGLSGDMDGAGERSGNGWTRVTAIDNVYSVDLVSRPASNLNLFESEGFIEGDVQDKVAADEDATKLTRTWSATCDLINRAIWNYDSAPITREKKIGRVIELANEFISLIKGMNTKESVRTAGGVSADSPRITESEQTDSITESDEMDLKALTLTELTAARPDIVKSIQEAVASTAASNAAIAAEKTRADAAEAKVKELEGKLGAIAARESALKLANEACDEKKLPAAARTAVFMESLVRAGDKPAMLALVEDRVASGVTPVKPAMDNPERHPLTESEGGSGQGVTQEEIDKLLGV